MKLPLTLSLYIGRRFMLNVLIVFVVFMTLITIVDAVEIMRRAYNKDVPFLTVLQMAFLKFPVMGQKLSPFIVLVSAVMTFSTLTRSHELIVARSAGISVWQFLMPAIITSFILGILVIAIINPLSCVMISRFDNIESKYFRGSVSSLAVSPSGLWFRQKNDASGSEETEHGDSIVHASRAGHKEGELYDVIIFVYRNRDSFVRRIDAKRARLENEFWRLEDVVITEPNKISERLGEYFLETELTLEEISNSLAPPETISFWELPAFIDTLKDAGFSAVRHQLHLFSIMISPIFYAVMIIVAAIFSLRPPRQGKTGLLISGSIITGFLIYFLTDLVSALGLSGSIPILLAAWVPVAITALTGVTLLLHLEDG